MNKLVDFAYYSRIQSCGTGCFKKCNRRRFSSIWAKYLGWKAEAVVSVSHGEQGGFGENHHLRQSLVFLDVPTMQQPEAYISHAADLFDASGKLTSEKTKEFLRALINAYAAWVAKIKVIAL